MKKALPAGCWAVVVVFAVLDLLALGGLFILRGNLLEPPVINTPALLHRYDRCAIMRLDDAWVTRSTARLVWTVRPRLAVAYRYTDSHRAADRGVWQVVPFLDAPGERYSQTTRSGGSVRRLPADTPIPEGRLARWKDGEIVRKGTDLVWTGSGKSLRFPVSECLAPPVKPAAKGATGPRPTAR